jgi:hypothetical protein
MRLLVASCESLADLKDVNRMTTVPNRYRAMKDMNNHILLMTPYLRGHISPNLFRV